MKGSTGSCTADKEVDPGNGMLPGVDSVRTTKTSKSPLRCPTIPKPVGEQRMGAASALAMQPAVELCS